MCFNFYKNNRIHDSFNYQTLSENKNKVSHKLLKYGKKLSNP